MNIEKRKINMLNIIIIIVLAAILVTAFGGFMMQRQTMPSRDNSMGRITDLDLMQPKSAQSGPTGTLVMSTGILLLLVGFGVIVVMLWARRNLDHNPT